MRIFLSFLAFFTLLSNLYSQDTVAYRPFEQDILHFNDLYFRFNKSPKVDSLDAVYHGVEFGFMKSQIVRMGHHVGSGSIYIGQELGYRKREFIHGTRIGGWASGNLLTLGMEFSHHTDYSRHAINFWPIVGLGMYPVTLSVSFRVRITGKSFQPVNKANLNVTFPLFNLKKWKEEIKPPPDSGTALPRNHRLP